VAGIAVATTLSGAARTDREGTSPLGLPHYAGCRILIFEKEISMTAIGAQPSISNGS
jgi:hypothetical protein